jgi:hypothetical protein
MPMMTLAIVGSCMLQIIAFINMYFALFIFCVDPTFGCKCFFTQTFCEVNQMAFLIVQVGLVKKHVIH